MTYAYLFRCVQSGCKAFLFVHSLQAYRYNAVKTFCACFVCKKLASSPYVVLLMTQIQVQTIPDYFLVGICHTF